MENTPTPLMVKPPYLVKRLLLARDLAMETQPGKVLDIGCYDGLFLSLLGDGIENYGIDILEVPLLDPDQITFKKHDVATGLPYEDAGFDLVATNEVIEHILDTGHFLQECHRV